MNEVQVLKAPMEQIAAAITAGLDLEKLAKAMELQERWEANQARKEYALAFASVQEKITPVIKTRLNTQTHSKNADIGDILEVVKPIYTAEGFSMTFYENDTDKPEHMRVFCDVLYKSGHKETYHIDVPLDGIGIKGAAMMTKIHGKGSAATYGRRYLTCMILNIPTTDNDGNTKAPEAAITEDELLKLRDWMNSTETKEADLYKYLGVASAEQLTKPMYEKALAALKVKAQKKDAPKPEAKK